MSKFAARSEAIKEWSVEIIGIAGFGGIQWLLTPLIDLDDFIKVNETILRVISIALIVLVWLGFILYKRLRQKWDEDAFIEGLVNDIDDHELKVRAQVNIDTLGVRFADALQSQRQEWRSVLSGSLLKKPWYLMIGPPGSGKTTAIQNSGLEFASDSAGIEGVSGTRHCNWFFSRDAVLIDTAGRYTTQSSHALIDAVEWKGFLHLLRKHRPSSPINGIILMVSIADLLDQTSQQRSALATTLRERITEVENGLSTHIPVYLVLSKADRLAGFTEFFAHLDPEGRAQIWGVTSKETNPEQVDDLIADFEGFLSLQTQRMGREGTLLAHEEKDLVRKARIIAFPSQIDSIRSELKALVESVFAKRGRGAQGYLRGIYITSATQNGTPIDRVMRSIGSRLSIKMPEAPTFSGAGKSFFLKRLITDLVLKESHLVAENTEELSRKNRRKRWGYALIAGLVFIFLGLSAMGYVKARQEILETRDLFARRETLSPDLAHPEVSSRLVTLTSGVSLYMRLAAETPWRSLGLSPRETLMRRLNEAQATILTKEILPLLEQDLILRLKAIAAENPASYYHALAAYLQLETPRPAADLNHHLLAIYEPLLRSDLSDEIIEWSSEVLSKDERVVIQTNPELIQKARHQLWNLQQGVLMESLLAEALADAQTFDLKVSAKLGPYAEISLTSRDGTPPPNWIVPGLFTEAGYLKTYLPGRKAFIEQQLGDRYVLGQEGPLTEQDAHRKAVEVEQVYFNAYAEAWRDLLNNLTLRSIPNRTLVITRLENHRGAGDPIRLLFALVSDETDLEPPGSDAKSGESISQLEIQLGEGDHSELISLPDTYRNQLRDQFRNYNSGSNGKGTNNTAIDAMLHDLEEILKSSDARPSAGALSFDQIKDKLAGLPEPWKQWYGLLIEQSRQVNAAH